MTDKEINDDIVENDVNDFISIDNDELILLQKSSKKMNDLALQMGYTFMDLIDKYFAFNTIQDVHKKNINILGQRYFRKIKNRPWHVDLNEGKIVIQNKD